MASSKATLKPNDTFQKDLAATPSTIFDPLADLGYFGWKPKGPHKSLSLASSEDMIGSIELHITPDSVCILEELNRLMPLEFAVLAPQEIVNAYPYGQYDLASLRVAFKDRGVNKNMVSFFFGGSTLHMLATRSIPEGTKYLTTKVPGTDVVMVVKYKEYAQDYSNLGFQFERLVTGKAFNDRHKEHFVEHSQLMKVAGYGILFSAESDAVESGGNPVEIKVNTSIYWGTKTMFQMISNGSSTLYSALRGYGSLQSVRTESLRMTTATALNESDVSALESNIHSGLEALNGEAENGCLADGTCACSVFELSFSGNDILLAPFSGKNNILLPPANVVTEMLS